MRFDAFIGGSYESQAVTADQERTVNWYAERLQSPGATAQSVLYPTPGVDALSFAPTGTGRGHWYGSSREFVVIGSKLYEADSGGALTERGDVGIGGPVTIVSNGDGGNQLFITSAGNGFCYDLSANTLTQVTAMDGKCTMADFIDGYVVALDATTSTLYLSALLDASTWEPGLNFAQRSLAPDRWLSMKVSNRYIWLLGEETTEVWYDTGENFPFAPAPSGLIQYGIAAPFSAKTIGTAICWLAQTKHGKMCVVRSEGFSPQVISHYPLETAVQNYRNSVDAVADVYSEAGHTFYLLHFDGDGTSWAFDETTGQWAERGSWRPELRRFTSWRPRFYARAFNQHRVLDGSGPYLYRMGFDLTGDVDGLEIRRLRRCPAISKENKRIFYSSFEGDLEPGLGSKESEIAQTENVSWTDLVLASASGSTLSKVAENDDSWDGGGYSTQFLNNMAGACWYTNAQVDRAKAFGFGTTPVSGDLDSIQFGIKVNEDNTVSITENGTELAGYGTTAVGDVFKVYVTDAGEVTYYQNGTLLYTSLNTATFPLYVIGAFGTTDAVISNAVFYALSGVPPEYDPVVMLRMSDDGGKTWGREQMRSAGKLGEYKKRVRWNRLGQARRRVFEVSVSAPIPWRMTGAYLEMKGGG